MAIAFQLPSDLEQSLRHEIRDLDAEAKEVLLVELYRRDRITHVQLADALGLGRLEAEGILKKHNVTEDLPTNDEILQDVRALTDMHSRT